MSYRLDPDQARHFVGPDLDPICLQWLSADDTSRQIVNWLQNRHRHGLLLCSTGHGLIGVPIGSYHI